MSDDIEERLSHVEELSKTKTLRTCEELLRHGVSKNGVYIIDPDGELIGHDPISVYCMFDDGIAVTEVTHALNEEVIEVENCEDIQCFNKTIDYQVPMEQIEALISLSENCEQAINFGCKYAALEWNFFEERGGWLDRKGIFLNILNIHLIKF